MWDKLIYLWENFHLLYDLPMTCIQYLGHVKLNMFNKITLGQCPGYVKSHISYKSGAYGHKTRTSPNTNIVQIQ